MSKNIENEAKFAEFKENCASELIKKEYKKTEEGEEAKNLAKNEEENYAAKNEIKSMKETNAMELSGGEDCNDEHATKVKADTTTTTTKTDSTVGDDDVNTTITPANESYMFKMPAPPLALMSSASTTSTTTAATTPTNITTTNVPFTTTSTTTSTGLIKKTPSDFIFGKCIGEGSFSSVYLAMGRQDRRECAIKVCDKHHILRERKQVYVRRERELLQVMSHTPGFVNLICTFQDNRSLYFVMTYAPNGELFSHIKRIGCFSVECARHYAAELVLACEQMHRRNVVHRDLKPENILLDAKMHTLIADFGSAKLLTTDEIESAILTYQTPEEQEPTTTPSPSSSATSLTSIRVVGDDCDDVFSDEVSDESAQQQRYRHKRKGSFVGTAQYVSPEVLQNMPIIPAADLWALGCIIYHMIAGRPPFRGYNDFAIFKEILAANYEFPENFDKAAESLVRQLLKMKPTERIGAQDDLNAGVGGGGGGGGGYVSIRSHEFFANIDFQNIRQQTPPKIQPRLPTFKMDEDDENPATESNQLINELAAAWKYASNPSDFNTNVAEKQRLLEVQKTNKWHYFTENEVILKRGLVNRHKGLFATKLMLLLTTGPQLIYIDPVEMIKKGKINWSIDLHVEIGNRRLFYIHTTLRTHFFEVLEGTAEEWVEALTKVHDLYFISAGARSQASLTSDSTSSLTLTLASPTNSLGASELDASLVLHKN